MSFRRACVVSTVVAFALAVMAAGGAWWYLSARVAEERSERGLAADLAAGANDRSVPTGDGRGAPASPGAPEADTTAGGRLRLAGADPTTLDPALVRDVLSAEYIYEVFSGLVTLSPELNVIPDLAVAWQVSPAGNVYTFTVRTDAVFHDGRPVTAADVVSSIERACDPATGSRVAATYLGDIVGCLDKLEGSAAEVSGITAPDDQHVVFEIDAPKVYFLSKLTYPTSFVVDKSQIAAGPGWLDRPNGTGPFRVARYTHGETLVLERNDQYYGRVPHLDAVEYELRPVTAMTLYENGEIDAVAVGMADRARVTDPLNPLSLEVIEGAGDLGLSYVGFNTEQAPFDDRYVRRALNFAVDKRRLAAVILRGSVAPADWILPPGMPGHTAGISPYTYDPARARAELALSRYGAAEALPPITLSTSGSGGGNTPAEAVVDMVAEVLGLDVSLEQTPWETFQEDIAEGRFQAFMLGWSADYPDPQDFLDVLFHSASALNYTGYENAEVDALLEAARVEQDRALRLDMYSRAERLILEDAPWLPLYSGVETWLVAPQVHGFELSPIVLPRLANVWLAP